MGFSRQNIGVGCHFLLWGENFEFLKTLNFEVEEFGINSIIVKAHPVWLPIGNEDNSIKKVIELNNDKDYTELN